MKLIRYGSIGEEKPGLVDADGVIRDLSGVIDDICPMTLNAVNLARIKGLKTETLPRVMETPRFGACVGDVGKMICIGLNYTDHAAETGLEVPKEPIIFAKFTSAICGANDDVVLPRGSKKLDWEVELGVVIGQEAKYVPEAEALDYVAGYCIINDISERSYQIERGGQWVKGKSCDTFGPMGPFLVTSDEVPDPQNLNLSLSVDGHRYQQGSTKTMVFGVAYLIHYLSQFFTLYPGDVISTGTPPGVGMGQKPEQVFLRVGQTMHVAIEGLGEQSQRVIADPKA